jgi:hypothetical protein
MAMDGMTTGALVVTYLVTAGCGGAVQVGLANAQSLGSSPAADDLGHDVVADGAESCGAGGASPLRGRQTACARGEIRHVARARELGRRPEATPAVEVRCTSARATGAQLIGHFAPMSCKAAPCSSAGATCSH